MLKQPVREQESRLVEMPDEELDKLAEITEQDVLDAKVWAEASIKDPILKAMLNAEEKDDGNGD